MSTTQPKQNIHLALAAILKDIEAIAKDKKNEAQGFKFRGIDDIYNSLHPIFAAHGVVCLPSVEKVETTEAGKTSKGTQIYRTQATVLYTFVAADGSSSSARMVGEGMDSGDKGTAKAMSVAHKYLLLQTFLIPTSDIVDGDYYDPTIDPREEIRKSKEEDARRVVMKGGDNIPLPDDGEAKLAEKRAALEKSAAEREAREKEENEVLDKKTPPKPEEKTRKGRKTAPEPPPEPEEEENDTEAWEEHKIEQITVAKFVGKKLGELTFDDIKGLKEGWCERYAEKIKLNPAKVIESNMILAAYAALSEK